MLDTIVYYPEQIAPESSQFRVQLLEVAGEYLLLRLRGGQIRIDRRHRIVDSLESRFANLDLTLSDARGHSVRAVEGHEGGLPFSGLYDVAFPAGAGLDLSSDLSLANGADTVTFRLSPARGA